MDLVFPAKCLMCGKLPKPICLECVPELGVFQSSERDFYATDLSDSVQKILSDLKDRNRTAFIPVLANGLAPCLAAAISITKPDLLICPPSAKRQYQKRGFNPALEIFVRANPTSLRVSDSGLKHLRQPLDQRELGFRDRQLNQSDLYKAKVRSGRVLLIDDVRTTGATLLSAADALLTAGVNVVGTCVLAQRI